ncbi:MAG: hypothetical protein IPL39_08250 [Opitutaceae bacterium]|nr:hypothetical protein [Opitutaceae bacterium]
MPSFRPLLSAWLAAALASPFCAALDRNRDGISDIWTTAYPAAGVPTADLDGDGFSTLAEALAGTNPASAANRFTAATETDPSGSLGLRWLSVPGKRYTLEASSDLRHWSEFAAAQLPSGPDLTALVHPAGSPVTPTPLFWRIRVSDQDTDADGLNDWEESQLGTSSTERDTDHDGLPDSWEAAFGLEPTVADASADPDTDGLTNAAEYAAGTDPVSSDRLAPFPDNASEFPGSGDIPFFWRADWYVQNWIGCRNRYWLDRTADHGKAVLLGDSITQFWWTSADAFAFPTANRGIMGDFTRGILFRLQTDVLDFDPPAISLLIGTNDLSAGIPPETIAANITTILDRIEAWTQTRMMAGKPRVAVVVNLIMPRGNPEPANDVRPAVAELNQRIVALAAGRPRTAVCDSWSLYADADGFPDPVEFTDLLHPEPAVYPRWRDALVAAFATINFPQ